MPVIFHLLFVYLLINCILTLYVLTAPEVKAVLDENPLWVTFVFLIAMTFGAVFLFRSSRKMNENKLKDDGGDLHNK